MNKINDPDQYGLIHVIEIWNFDVYFNGALIAESYERFDAMRHYKPPTKANRLKFCKAVIWSIIPHYMQAWDKTNRKSITVQDDAELRRYIALYPALVSNQDAEMQQIMADEMPIVMPEIIAVPEPARDILPILAEGLGLTDEEINGFPAVYQGIDLMPEVESMVKADLEEMNGHYEYRDGIDELDYADEDLPVISEMWALINPMPVVIRQWTHRGMSIIEEMITA